MILHAIHKLSHAAPGCSPPAPLPSAQGLARLPFCPPGLVNIQAAGRKGIFAGGCPALRLLFSTGGSALLRGYFVQASVSWFMPSLVCFQHTTARCGTPYRISPFRKNFILLSGTFYLLASLWYNKAAILRQHRTIPALRLKHRFGGCGTASALPKCSIIHKVLSALLA